jgi:CheY-like chemotaxis protein
VNDQAKEADKAAGAPGKTGLKKSILMLEDEVALSAELAPYFEHHSFKLVAVTNGVDGLKQVIANDFSVIICDMMMPNLPGDMFYRAVERTKPNHCQRFIFITGYRGNQDIEDFIRRVNGVVLWKPFQTQQLMDTIEIVVRKTGG